LPIGLVEALALVLIGDLLLKTILAGVGAFAIWIYQVFFVDKSTIQFFKYPF
jgi:hypothetical protein